MVFFFFFNFFTFDDEIEECSRFFFFFLSNCLNSNSFSVIRCNRLNLKLCTCFSYHLAIEVESHLAGSSLINSNELEWARFYRNQELGRKSDSGRLSFKILWLWFCHCPIRVTAFLFSFHLAWETWSGIMPETTLRWWIFFKSCSLWLTRIFLKIRTIRFSLSFSCVRNMLLNWSG